MKTILTIGLLISTLYCEAQQNSSKTINKDSKVEPSAVSIPNSKGGIDSYINQPNSQNSRGTTNNNYDKVKMKHPVGHSDDPRKNVKMKNPVGHSTNPGNNVKMGKPSDWNSTKDSKVIAQ